MVVNILRSAFCRANAKAPHHQLAHFRGRIVYFNRGRTTMKLTRFTLLIVVMAAFAIVFPVLAQDATPESTPEPTLHHQQRSRAVLRARCEGQYDGWHL